MKTTVGLTYRAALVAVCIGVTSAQADTIQTFNLVDVTFQDGGTAAGSFALDLTNNTVYNVHITTSPGSALPGGNYMSVESGVTTACIFNDCGADFGGNLNFDVEFRFGAFGEPGSGFLILAAYNASLNTIFQLSTDSSFEGAGRREDAA
jgi:hypothetical protein